MVYKDDIIIGGFEICNFQHGYLMWESTLSLGPNVRNRMWAPNKQVKELRGYALIGRSFHVL
jgi:hypothetical protein